MAPDPASSMCLPKARQHQKVPLRLTSTTFSQCSSVTGFGRRLAARDAGIVDEDVDLAVPRHEFVRDLGDALGIRHVQDDDLGS